MTNSNAPAGVGGLGAYVETYFKGGDVWYVNVGGQASGDTGGYNGGGNGGATAGGGGGATDLRTSPNADSRTVVAGGGGGGGSGGCEGPQAAGGNGGPG